MNTQLGTKPDNYKVMVQNADTVTIAPGTPVFLAFNATADGVAVVLPSTGGSTKANFLYGVYAEGIPLPVNDYGQCQVWGMVNSAVVIGQTRSASTANWASLAAFSTGQALSVNTALNGFQTIVLPTFYATGSASTDTLAMNNGFFLPQALIAGFPTVGTGSIATANMTSSASATSDTRTVISFGLKVLLRTM